MLSIKAFRLFLIIFTASLWIGLTPTVVSAQGSHKTETDAEGMLKIVPFESTTCVGCQGKKLTECTTCNGGRKKLDIKCPECNGKKQAPCRQCLGFGNTYDPFAITPCLRCDSRGFVQCPMCRGALKIQYDNGTSGPSCGVCDKKGAFKCQVCQGARHHKLENAGGKPIESATKEELDALKKKYLPIMDSNKKYSHKDSKAGVIDFTPLMEKTAVVYPTFKDEAKQAKTFWELMEKKHKTLNNIDDFKAGVRKTSANAAANLAAAQLNAIEYCLSVFEANQKRKIAEAQKKKEEQKQQ